MFFPFSFRPRHVPFILLLLALVFPPLLGSAKETPPTPDAAPVTLDALVAETLDKNPELNVYRAEINAARGARTTAGAFPNPQLQTQTGSKRVREVSGAITEGYVYSVSVQQTFEYPSRLALRKAIANRQTDLARLGLEQFRAALAARARLLGYTLLVGQEKAAAAQAVADRAEELLAVLVQRDPAGITPLLETRVIEAGVLTARRRAITATRELQSAAFELNLLRGRPLQTPVRVARGELRFESLPGAEALLAAARENNFELRTRRVELAQQGFRVSLTKNERVPALTVAPYFSQENSGTREVRAGVNLAVPLPIFDQNQGNVRTAEARRQQAEASYAVTQREVERKILEGSLAYAAQLAEIRRLRPDAARQFEEAAALADRNYRLGAIPVSTYIQVQDQYLAALDAILDTQREALENRQKLELLAGLNTPESRARPEAAK